jgi:hypothetical protein
MSRYFGALARRPSILSAPSSPCRVPPVAVANIAARAAAAKPRLPTPAIPASPPTFVSGSTLGTGDRGGTGTAGGDDGGLMPIVCEPRRGGGRTLSKDGRESGGGRLSTDGRRSKGGPCEVLGALESMDGRPSKDGRGEAFVAFESLRGRLSNDGRGLLGTLESLDGRLSNDGRCGGAWALGSFGGVPVRKPGLSGVCGEYGSLRPVDSARSRSAKGLGVSLLESEAVLIRSGNATLFRLGPPLSDKGLGTRF